MRVNENPPLLRPPPPGGRKRVEDSSDLFDIQESSKKLVSSVTRDDFPDAGCLDILLLCWIKTRLGNPLTTFPIPISKAADNKINYPPPLVGGGREEGGPFEAGPKDLGGFLI